MNPVIFVGDERSAAGWRLAGVAVVVPRPGAEAAALALARENAELVLLGSTTAAALPEPLRREAALALRPLLLELADPDGAVPVPDLAARLRNQLGMQA